MTTDLVVVGAGGFGRETLDVVEAINRAAGQPVFAVIGVVDSAPSDVNLTKLAKRGVRWLGTERDWIASGHPAQFVIGVGDPAVRAAIAARFADCGPAATLVHPSATVGSFVTLGRGVVVCAGVQISTEVAVGEHVHLNPSAVIGHDTELASYVSVFPAGVVAGDCRIGERAALGTASVVMRGLTVGADAVIGAGACVVRDVPAGLTVKGVPAR